MTRRTDNHPVAERRAIMLRLTDAQAWDLERVLSAVCPCAGGSLPPGVDQSAVHALCDALHLALGDA